MTGHKAAICRRYERRDLCPAAAFCQRTARVERAACWRIDRARYLALDGHFQSDICGVGHWSRGYKSLGVRMDRICEESFASCQFDNPTEIHDGYSMTNMLHNTKIVRDKHEGDPRFLLEVHEKIEDLCLHGHVESGDCLVSDDD